MHVIYFTSSTSIKDFEAKIKVSVLNPSNQNFHHALIKACSVSFETIVISSAVPINDEVLLRPLEFQHTEYHFINSTYLEFPLDERIGKILNGKTINPKECIFVIDSLNYRLASAARKYARNEGIVTVGVITDNPFNISNLSILKKLLFVDSFKKYDKYITLTSDLDKLANRKGKDNLTISGCVEPRIKPASDLIVSDKPYFFFGGALYKKYGVKTLVEAFLASESTYNLYIAGHGPLTSYMEGIAHNHPNVKFLGLISQAAIRGYEMSAIASINPRPFSKKFDKYSVPSKVIEYATNGCAVISTYHSDLHKKFGKVIYWTKEDKNSLIKMINKFCNEEIKTISKKAKSVQIIALRNYSVKHVGLQLATFLSNK